MRPVDHFAAFCASLTQSDDRWEGKPLKLEPWQRRFWRARPAAGVELSPAGR